jgi:hypothetical protein
MSIIKTSTAHRGALDHFEPEQSLDPSEQRRLRGRLEQMDYTAFAANQGVLAAAVGGIDLEAVQRLAVATAQARALWIKTALDFAASGQPLSREQVGALADRRAGFDELCSAYEGLRRTIERGYISYRPTN